MIGDTGKYIQRLIAFISIVLGAKITSIGFAVLKTAGVTGKPDPIEAIIVGAIGVFLGCLLMAMTYVQKSRKKGGRKCKGQQ